MAARGGRSVQAILCENGERDNSSKMNKYTLVILDYESSEVRILQVDNDEIKRKWNDDVSEYVTGDQDKGGLGYGRDQVEWLYSCEVRMRADFVTNYG